MDSQHIARNVMHPTPDASQLQSHLEVTLGFSRCLASGTSSWQICHTVNR